MVNLTDRQTLLTIDKSGALLSTEQLPDQIQQAWSEANGLELPDVYKNVDKVVVCGMGASWLGAHIMQGLLADQLTVPIVVAHDYELPKFVNSNSLVIASSYSGTTEETVTALEEAHKRNAKILTISTGGNLSEFAKANNYPHYTFVGTHNPANSPRLGLGYSIAAQIAILSKLGLIAVSSDEVQLAIQHLNTRIEELRPESKNNAAQQMAQQLVGSMPIIISGTFLIGIAHTFANQVNETSKTFGTFMQIPELNHHNMEGLAHPEEAKKLKYVFLESSLYDPKVQLRFQVTKEVLEQNKVGHLSYQVQGNSKLIQAFDALLFGSMTTYYLAMIYEVDPSPNPYVDYFKKRLKELS